MSDWIGLRAFVEQWVDSKIAAEPDLAACAVLTFNRARIVDMVEAALLRQLGLAGQGQWLQ